MTRDPDRTPSPRNTRPRQLSYGGYNPRPSSSGLSPGAQFFAGMVAGVAVSIVAWGIAYAVTVSGGNTSGDLWVVLAIAVLGMKLVAGVVGLCLPDWRMAGGGLLMSIALGLLIGGYSLFAAVCGGR